MSQYLGGTAADEDLLDDGVDSGACQQVAGACWSVRASAGGGRASGLVALSVSDADEAWGVGAAHCR